MSGADLPVPFEPRIHRPLQLGYGKAAFADAAGSLIAGIVAGGVRALLRGVVR